MSMVKRCGRKPESCAPKARASAQKAASETQIMVLSFVFAVLLLFVGCDAFFLPDDYQPSGTAFNLNPNIEVVGITGGLTPVGSGLYTLDMTVRSSGSGPASDVLPGGLFFTSSDDRVEHMIALKSQDITADSGDTVNRLGVFGCNKGRMIPGSSDSYDVGPVTDDPELQRLVRLVRSKDISSDLGMIQRAVYLVTDSTGLTQAYVDSIEALPTEKDFSW